MRINHPTVTWPLIPVVRLAPAKLVMADPGEVLDLVTPRQFDESEWIGKGRTYPASRQDVPPELYASCAVPVLCSMSSML